MKFRRPYDGPKRQILWDEAFRFGMKTELKDYTRVDNLPKGYRKQMWELEVRIQALENQKRRGSQDDMMYSIASVEKRRLLDARENEVQMKQLELRIIREKLEDKQRQKTNQKKVRPIVNVFSGVKNMDGPNIAKMILQYL
jgi:hypothetical protein